MHKEVTNISTETETSEIKRLYMMIFFLLFLTNSSHLEKELIIKICIWLSRAHNFHCFKLIHFKAFQTGCFVYLCRCLKHEHMKRLEPKFNYRKGCLFGKIHYIGRENKYNNENGGSNICLCVTIPEGATGTFPNSS